MTRIVLPKSLLPDFESAKGPTEVRDMNGQTLGWFLPGITEVPDDGSATIDVIRQAFANGGGKSISEIWRSLGVDYEGA